ncbi:unnamed protein product [Bursaphelenchus xylophilus]|uniref:(pine wood nematode) hypothetical protein n=1 Tax=Bursaphelenchus xylophilus TaxID=6326 RepID=A0A1I7S5P7_BURXY|nr:unnamed protein product [Bursaphelenchus xylophilus]CAG9124940.1 unnamed protein product [Bursaphelenchus xylophilus]
MPGSGEDNVAIQIDGDDDIGYEDVYNSTIEANGSSNKASLQHLLPTDDDLKSLQSSVHQSLKSAKLITTKVFEKLKGALSATKLWWITIGFSFLGGYLFMWLEVEADLAVRRNAFEDHLVSRDVFLFNIEMIHNSSSLRKRQEWKDAIMQFEERVGCRLPEVKTVWTFWMSVLYASTISTTIGYGNIGCITMAGRVATMLYAMMGIPLFVVILDKIGTILLKALKNISYVVDDLWFFLCVRFYPSKARDSTIRRRYKTLSVKYARRGFFRYSVPPSESKHVEKVEVVAERKITPRDVGSMFVKNPVRPVDDIIEMGDAVEQVDEVDDMEKAVQEEHLEPTDSRHIPVVNFEENHTSVETRPRPLPRQGSIETAHSHHSSNFSSSQATDTNQSEDSEDSADEQKAPLVEEKVIEKTEEKEEEEEEEERDPPVMVAIVLTVGHIATFAALFCLWEEWDYFTSFYFLFISLSTIGFGDVTPAYPEYMVGTFLVVLIGLAMVTVCINVIQEKITLMYMRVLTRMLEQYIKAQEEGDPEALKGFVEGFNNNAKFLMPLLSKNESAKVMKRFRQTAKDRGISLPPALTDIDPETGQFSFCNQKSEDLDGFIEKTNKEAQSVLNSANFQRNTCATQTTFHCKAKKVQTSVPEWLLANNSQGLQFSAELSDSGNQTDTESVDSGVQVEVDMESTYVQFDHEFIDTAEISTCVDVVYTDTSIQPEVSFIRQLMEEEESGWEMSESESDDDVTEHHEVSERRRRIQEGFQRKASDDKRHRKHDGKDSVRQMKSRVVQTSVELTSTESQAGPSSFTGYNDFQTMTVIARKDAEIQPDLIRMKNNFTQMKRKLKDAAIQNYLIDELLIDLETQVELEMVEAETQVQLEHVDQNDQTDVETKNMNCQTEAVEFVNIKAIKDGICQTEVSKSNRKAQTVLTYTCKNIADYEERKKAEYSKAKAKFERQKKSRASAGAKEKNALELHSDELEVLKTKLFNLRLEHARRQKMENEPIEFDVRQETEKLLELLQNLRIAEGTMDKEEVKRLFQQYHFPIDIIEKDFNIDRLIQLLEEDSLNGDESEDDLLDDEIQMFMIAKEAQTENPTEDIGVGNYVEWTETSLQTDISAFQRAEQEVQSTPSTVEFGILCKAEVKDSSATAKPESVSSLIQTTSSIANEVEKEVQANPVLVEQHSQVETVFVSVGLSPLQEVIERNKPPVESQDTQTIVKEFTASAMQTEVNTAEKETEARPSTSSVIVDAIPATQNNSTYIKVIYKDSESQSAIMTAELSIQTTPNLKESECQATANMVEKSAQNEIEFAEKGSQSRVSSIKKQKDEKDGEGGPETASDDVFYPVDNSVQYEDPREFVECGCNALVSMFKKEKVQRKEGETDETTEEESYFLSDNFTQHETELIEMATMPEVSMFKLRTDGKQGAELTDDLAGICFPKDAEVQHDRGMEDKVDFALQPHVSMFRPKKKRPQSRQSASDQAELDDDIDFMIDSFTQHGFTYSHIATGMDIEYASKEVTAVVETRAYGVQSESVLVNNSVQTTPSVAHIEIQAVPSTSEAATIPTVSMYKIPSEASEFYRQKLKAEVGEVQFMLDSESQYDITNEDKECQAQVQTRDHRVGEHVIFKENSTQSSLSTFKINEKEYQKRRESMDQGARGNGEEADVDSPEVYFLIDASTSHDYSLLSTDAETQQSADLKHNGQQTVYSGTIVDAERTHETHLVNVKENRAACSLRVPLTQRETTTMKLRELTKVEKKAVKRVISREVQTKVEVKEIGVGRTVRCAPFACQMSVDLHHWGVQCESLNSQSQYAQTQMETRNIESQAAVESSSASIQTIKMKPSIRNSKKMQTEVLQTEINADVYVSLQMTESRESASRKWNSKRRVTLRKQLKLSDVKGIQTESTTDVVFVEPPRINREDFECQVNISKDLVEFSVNQAFRKPARLMRATKTLPEHAKSTVEKSIVYYKVTGITQVPAGPKTSRLIKRRPLKQRIEVSTQTERKSFVSFAIDAELRCESDELYANVRLKTPRVISTEARIRMAKPKIQPKTAKPMPTEKLKLPKIEERVQVSSTISEMTQTEKIIAPDQVAAGVQTLRVPKRTSMTQTDELPPARIRKTEMYQAYKAEHTHEASTQTGVLARLATQYKEQPTPDSPKTKKPK